MSYTIAVRALCEFGAKTGDLDLRFTPAPSAQEGIAGHGVVCARRGSGYQAELSLEGRHGPLLVRGRADGYDRALHLLEEIKTFRGELARMPENQRQLHWAQLRVYGHLLCQQLGLERVALALVYFDIATQQETVLRATEPAAALAAQFASLCERFLDWAAQEAAHRAARDAALSELAFPHPEFRPGQRQLAANVYQASRGARCVMLQAPTGIGKTIGTLFPALKAAARHDIDKVFFLTAKTPGRQLALDALQAIRRAARVIPLRVLELTAREKACEHPDKACHGESCPLARGFFDRLPAARRAAVQAPLLDRAALREVALAHAVCPYHLGSEMARWSDVIVGDYNYYFDLGAMLHTLTLANQWRVSVLVDEAHNLVARARSMYSAELQGGALRAARALAPHRVKKELARVTRAWGALERGSGAQYETLEAPPQLLLEALQQACAGIGDQLAEHPGPLEPALQRFYFDALHFCKLAESFGAHSLIDIQRGDGTTLCIRNIEPAHFLKPRFAAAHSSALFSATLSPWNYYSDALGLPPTAAWIEIESPFDATQLEVRVASRISTRFANRARSVAPIVDLMARQFHTRPGNYLAFFSSFDYLEQVAAGFAEHHSSIAHWLQARRMSEADRGHFLARFTPEGCGIGFAVLGGAFAEGIDLPGERLIGAFIATLGLPQLNPVNEQIRQRMQASFGAGYDYTYLYPGLQKVVQAAGRVIRSSSDRGVVHLIDERYARPEVRALLPRWWTISSEKS